MVNGVSSFLKGTDGKVSATRVSTLIVVGTIMGAFLAHNIKAMLMGSGEFISVGWNEVVLLTTVLGSKVAQHFSEGKAPKEPTMTSSVSNGGASTNATPDEDADLAKG